MSWFSLVGAKVQGQEMVPSDTHHQADFPSAVWDTNAFYTPTANNVLVVRSPRRAGYYQIRVAVRWTNPWHDMAPDPMPLVSADDLLQKYYHTYIEINGNSVGDGRSTALPVPGATGTTQHFAAEANLDFNDAVSVKLWQNLGVEVRAYVYLGLRRLGREVSLLAAGTADTD
jgi:hypothetical protein